MLKVLLAIVRRKHITNADLLRALDNAGIKPAPPSKIIEYQDKPAPKQENKPLPKEEA